MFTMVKNDAAVVARLGAEVAEVQIQSMHDTGGDKNRRAACNDAKRTKREEYLATNERQTG